MYILYDEDEYETIITPRLCTTCQGDRRKCHGVGCNGSFGVGSKRRDPAEVKIIKAKRQIEHEDKILAEAELIKIRRGIK
jgi:hypothetical protein